MPHSSIAKPALQGSSDERVTLVVKHRVKAGTEQAYEAWLRRIVSTAQTFPGHLGVDIVPGTEAGLRTFTSVLRFCSTAHVQQWLDSPQRLALLKEAEQMLADGDQTEIAEAAEFWFTAPAEPGMPAPPRWKQAVVSLGVILPQTLLLPFIWGPVLRLNGFLSNYVVSTFLVTLTIVLLVVYLLMPAATRWCAPWLNAPSSSVKEPL
jgi:antibiotic biosynthesis monooxygenase (ABM) superfamily enzyme